jgi:hypothetical protein
MWVIFRDPNTAFNHLDKYVHEIVEDKDILTYQIALHERSGGRIHELNQTVFFLQQFVTTQEDVEYFARRYNTWLPRLTS